MDKLNNSDNDVKPEEIDETSVTTYGLLVIFNAYNDGKITFREFLILSTEWAEKIKEIYGKEEQK